MISFQLAQAVIALCISFVCWRLADTIVKQKYAGTIVNEADKLKETIELFAVLLGIIVALWLILRQLASM